eukprot:m.216080 g.216080  ORF g.216080 m.216080 type:complete len:478 (+) comp54094_c0_seq1:63-1496(+)
MEGVVQFLREHKYVAGACAAGAAVGAVLWQLRAPPLLTPGPPLTSFFLGNVLELQEALTTGQFPAYLQEMHAKHGRLVSFSALGRRTISITDPNHARELAFLDGKPPDTLENGFGMLSRGLLILHGEPWARHRRLIQKAFTIQSLSNTVKITNRTVVEFTAPWLATPGQSVDVEAAFTEMTSVVLFRSLFGEERPQSLAGVFGQLAKDVSARFYFPKWMWRWQFSDQPDVEKRVAFLKQELWKVVKAKRESLQADSNDLLSILLRNQADESEASLTDEEILDEVILLYFAGHESTAHSLAFLLYQLARHPHVYQRAVSEVLAVCGPEGDISMDSVHELPYLEMVIKESLRTFPISGGISRQLLKTTSIAGLQLHAGDVVLVPSQAFHNDPEIWPNPSEFNPDRFIEIPKAGTYLPFGAGPRMCIGNRFAMLELKTALVHILRRFRFEVDAENRLETAFFISLGSKSGVHLTVHPRTL